MVKKTSIIPLEKIDHAIIFLRGHKVMLDADLVWANAAKLAQLGELVAAHNALGSGHLLAGGSAAAGLLYGALHLRASAVRRLLLALGFLSLGLLPLLLAPSVVPFLSTNSIHLR
mgnify:CR=1 FL=1